MHLLLSILCFTPLATASLIPRTGSHGPFSINGTTPNLNGTDESTILNLHPSGTRSSAFGFQTSTPYSTSTDSTTTLYPLVPNLRNASSDTKNFGSKNGETDSSGFNSSQSPAFPHTGNWTQTDCAILRKPGAAQPWWNLTDAAEGWTQMMAAWNLPSRQTIYKGSTFSAFAFEVFGQATAEAPVECANINDVSCQVVLQANKCGNDENNPDVISPAGITILNSFVSLNNLFKYQSIAINDAQQPINQEMEVFTSTFAPVASSDTISKAQQILGIFSDVLSFVSAGALSSVFNAIKAFGEVSEDSAKTFLDVVNKGVSFTSDALAQIPTPSDDTDQSGVLTTILGSYITSLQTAQINYLSHLVDVNNTDDQQTTTSLVNTGFLLNQPLADANFTANLTASTTAMLYGFLIPSAWKASTSTPRPFILRVDKSVQACNGTFSSSSGLQNLMSDDTAKKTLWCDPDGNSFYLLNAPSFTPCTLVCGDLFTTLDGGDIVNLNGNNWGGIALKDLIKSSWAGFIQNGKKNGYTLTPTSTLQVGDDLAISNGTLPMLGGINTPGFFNFTICLDVNEAVTNIQKGSSYTGPICGESPSLGSTSSTINTPGSYTAGTCGVHVIQYQKNEGDENLLNNYQLDIVVKDNAGLEVGSATKQNAADPLIVVDSSLPFDLIVTAPGPVDSSPVEFWYADQYWNSSMSPQCTFGGYDSGARNGDCEFSCPLPSGSPPASATIAHLLPTKAVDAVGGATTFVNTFTTAPATISAHPAPTPTPTYVHGSCGVHVVQYQKTEQNLNPTTNYEIEVTLYDGSKKLLTDSGKVTAATLKPVQISGLDSPFYVTANATDNDPLDFSFGGKGWNSADEGQCTQGKYDSGERNMDCDFSC